MIASQTLKSIILHLFMLASLAANAVVFAADIVTLDGRQWTAATNGAPIRLSKADAFCSRLELGGYSNWQVPTLDQLKTLHDPQQPTGIRSPISIESCCVWSSTSLADLPSDDFDVPGYSPAVYRWGFMFDGGLDYYAGDFYNDGEALCTREQ